MDVDDNAHTAPHDAGQDSDDSMPQLQSVSNSSDSESEDGLSNNTNDTRPGGRYRRQHLIVEDDDDDAWTDDDGDEFDQEMPSLEPISAPVATHSATGSRRTRRADDEDQERDRRHPSQRTAAPNSSNNAPNSQPHNAPHAHAAPHIHLPHVHPPLFTTQLMTFLTGAGLPGVFFGGMAPPPPPKDSPENAAKIIAGLERVPHGLVRRLERVSGLQKDGPEELGAVGGDSGCAICWDKLLDGDGAAFASIPDSAASTTDAQSTSDSTSSTAAPNPAAEEIIALPCSHLFHASCLAPWFARPGQTTCPTCRFDVDPQGIIWYGGRKGSMGMGGPGLQFDMPFPLPMGNGGGAGPAPAGAGDRRTHGHEHDHEGLFFTEQELADAIDTWADDGPGGDFLGGNLIPNPNSNTGGFTFEWRGGPVDFTRGDPPAPEDEDDGPPPLEPMTGRQAAQPTLYSDANGHTDGDDDMPPLEPLQTPQASAPALSVPAPAATVRTDHEEDDIPPPLVPVDAPQVSAPAAPATAPTSAAAAPAQPPPAPTTPRNANANAPPPPPPHAQGQPAFTFGLDIIFSTLGPIPPPADLRAAGGLGDALGDNPALANANPANTNPGNVNPTATGLPLPGAQARPEREAGEPRGAFTFPGVSGVGLNTGAGRGRGGVTGAFGQLFRGFRRAAEQAGAQPHAHAGGQHGRGGAGNGGGIPPGFPGVQTAGPGGFRFHMNGRQPAPAPATGAPAADTGNTQGAAFGAPPHAQDQTQAQAQAAQNLGMAMLRALGIAPPAAAGAAAPAPVPGAGTQGPAQGNPGGATGGAGFQLPPWLAPPPGTDVNNPAASMPGVFQFPFAPTRRTTLPGGGVVFEFGTGPVPMPPNMHFHAHTHGHGHPPTQPAGNAANADTRATPPPPPQEWAPPPAPGPTFRDRVERREREAGLRCFDASCGVGPSDEDPFVELDGEARRMVEIYETGKNAQGERVKVCAHTFHPACLVSAQRARRGWREPVLDGNDEEVEVVCSVCRSEGVVPQAEWLAGTILPLD